MSLLFVTLVYLAEHVEQSIFLFAKNADLISRHALKIRTITVINKCRKVDCN